MTKIISLIENHSDDPALIAEHGLSLYIERADCKLLLDTGATGTFVENANALHIDLADITHVIISHSHYDHTGGLEAFFKINQKAQVFLRTEALDPYYANVLLFKKYIGMPLAILERYRDRFVPIEETTTIVPGVHLMFNEQMDKYFFCKDSNLLEKQGKTYQPDSFQHEQYLVLEEPNGLVILSSCSHNGIVNIVETVKARFPGRNIQSVIGGFHMKAAGKSGMNCEAGFVAEVAAYLKESVEQVHTCHCTGFAAFQLLQKILGDKVTYYKTGECILV